MGKTLIKPPLPILDYPNPLTKGLVACYPFFERGGNILHDISGRNNHGTLINIEPATDWTKTPYGYGLGLDGVNECISVPHSLSLVTPTFSLSIMTKIPPTTACSFFFYKSGISAPYPGYRLCINPLSSNQIGMWVGGSAWTTASFTWDNKWHFIVGAYDGINVKIYIDGVLLASQAQTYVQSATSLYIGAANNIINCLSGIVTNACIYNKGLLLKEIVTSFANPSEIYKHLAYNKYGKSVYAPSTSDMLLVM